MLSADLLLELGLEKGLRLEWHDYVALIAFMLALQAWVRFYLLPAKKEPGFHQFFISPQVTDGLVKANAKSKSPETRDITVKLEQSDLDIIILWGSQSGQSENMAKKLAHEFRIKLGIKVIASSLDQYDPETIAAVDPTKMVGLILATYGEGDPTDNAADFGKYISTVPQGNNSPLKNLNYFIFGLGSKKYQFYNRFVDVTDNHLQQAGAVRLGPIGKRDETAGSDNTWMEWKAAILEKVALKLGKEVIESSETRYQPGIQILEPRTAQQGNLHIFKRTPATLATSKLLSVVSECPQEGRTYLHVEVDLKGTGVSYETGDHVSIWPVNTDGEVEKFASLFGWDNSILDKVIELRPLENSGSSDLLIAPTTRRALLQYHLDICGLPSQDTVSLLVPYAPSEIAKKNLQMLLGEETAWEGTVVAPCTTLAGVIKSVCASDKVVWPEAAFVAILEAGPFLRPRNFSIASSPLPYKDRLAITVGVVETKLPNQGTFYGLTSNYLYHLHNLQSGKYDNSRPSYTELDSSSDFQKHQVAIGVRKSTFKLPEPQRAIIMVAAGSGIAPFRGFMQERYAQKKRGIDVGRSLLFYGCRSLATDYLYSDEWCVLDKETWFDVNVSCSRGSEKRYVQDELHQHTTELYHLLAQQNASLYICGSVGMAQGVKNALALIFDGQWNGRGGQAFIEQLKRDKRLLEDVWA